MKRYKEDLYPGRTYCSCSSFLYSIYNGILKPTSNSRIFIDYNRGKIVIECRKCGKQEEIPLLRVRQGHKCMD